ncbi:hypothetical protein [Kiloniella litopenaei]|uniref:hypothetical protein n=1 Tax=Kiloniella litopenaei TaxID=1549748 RepID=UPI003BABD4D7
MARRQPTSEAKIWDLINSAEEKLSSKEARLWETIKIIPQKWQEKSYGQAGGGFWVVAIYGTSILWYNDIEHGFNISQYKTYGTIEEYYCEQAKLEDVVLQITYNIFENSLPITQAGPPKDIK